MAMAMKFRANRQKDCISLPEIYPPKISLVSRESRTMLPANFLGNRANVAFLIWAMNFSLEESKYAATTNANSASLMPESAAMVTFEADVCDIRRDGLDIFHRGIDHRVERIHIAHIFFQMKGGNKAAECPI